jgi:hypothetical protein
LRLACLAVADCDHVAGAGEEIDLAELDLLLGVVITGRLEHDEERLAVVLELRPLVLGTGVLDCQLVQVEGARDVLELLV